MARLLKTLDPQLSAYRDRRFEGSQAEFEMCLRESTTVYVGNLSFFSTEEQIHEIFSKTGELKRIIMGLDKIRKTPCGFCFVVYYDRKDTEDCVKWINGTRVDDRPIRVDFDWGFKEGRQFGRGKSGGQVRDEYRTDFDEGRGGYGKIVRDQLELRKQMESGMAGSTEGGGTGMGGGGGRDDEWGDDKPRNKRQRTGGRDEDNPRFRGDGDSDDER